MKSNGYSFIIGNAGFIIASLVLPFTQNVSSNYDSGPILLKLLVEDTFSICNGVFHWFYWRGLWNLLTEAVPDLLVGGWSSTVLGLSAAILLSVLSSQTNIDMITDGSLKNGKTIEFPNEYFRHTLKPKN